MLPAAVAWNYVVERQLSGLSAAILARELVTIKNLSPANFSCNMKWTLDEVRETDYRRNRYFLSGSMNITIAIFQHLGPALVEQR
jgi:hypothetical protein